MQFQPERAPHAAAQATQSLLRLPKRVSLCAHARMLTRPSACLSLRLTQNVSFRKKLRLFTDDRRVEGTTMVVVLLYFLFIMLDFIVPELVFSAGLGGQVSLQYQQFIITWQRVFWFVDLIFLSFFLLEITVRVFAWGCAYLRDVLNLIDFLIVSVSFAMLWVTLEYTLMRGEVRGRAKLASLCACPA